MKYTVTKTYGNQNGISACFRQWRARGTHCRFLHGYALGFRFKVEAKTLDERNWVFNFGDFKWIKELLFTTFDHKTVVAADDPNISEFRELELAGIIQLVVLPDVGCEKFAEYIFNQCAHQIATLTSFRAKLVSVECFEHAANSAEVSK